MTEDESSDESSFATLIEQHRRELQVHCYRMVGSFEDAEDLLQETFLRAWTKRETFARGSNLRAWLYRIATNVCIDALRRRSRTVAELNSYAEVPWLQPFPDQLLDQVAQQRAVLVMRDVIGWSAAETADVLDTSVAAVNSALQRARATLRTQQPSGEHADRTRLSADERDLLQRYVELHENPERSAMAALVRHDIRVTMPPQPLCFDGWDSLAPLQEMAFGPDGFGDWKLLPTAVNRMPAAACYLRERGDDTFRAFKLDVLRIEDGLIAEITTFEGHLLERFGLPATL